MKRALWGVVMTVLASSLGCGGETGGGAEVSGSTDEAIKGGSSARSYPESADILMYKDGQLTAACSGAVIAPNVVLTAGHCVVGFDSWIVSTPFAKGGGASASQAATRYESNPTDSEKVNPDAKDVGLLFLDAPIVLDRYPTLASSPIASGTEVQNLGRIRNGKLTNSFYISKRIAALDATSIGAPSDYVALDKIEAGDSGGPDVLPGTHHIVAVNSGAGSGIELMARVDVVYDWIVSEVNAHGGF